ncbi:MAG: anti-sigma factor [Chthoniobacterales bacterium]
MNESREEQASLYALELLEPNESSAFENEMARDPELRQRVDELRELAAKFAYGAPLRMPSAELETRILNAIRVVQPARARASSDRFQWLPWALAACLAIACVILLADRSATRERLSLLEHRNAFAQLRIATLSSKLETAPNAGAVVVWDGAKQEGVLKVSDVPPNESNRDYQLWIVDPDQKQPVDAGVFHLEEKGVREISFRPKGHVTSAKAFAVSLERKGGVPKAQGPMVLVGK